MLRLLQRLQFQSIDRFPDPPDDLAQNLRDCFREYEQLRWILADLKLMAISNLTTLVSLSAQSKSECFAYLGHSSDFDLVDLVFLFFEDLVAAAGYLEHHHDLYYG
ncbi:hypothetical protein ACLKA6_017032 [Drosophila palustris]